MNCVETTCNGLNYDNNLLKWEEKVIKTNWGTVRGKQIGNGPRKILAIHGWLDNANTFDLVIPYFNDNITFLSLDFPGHGLSDHYPPGFIYDTRGYVGSIKRAVMSLGWDKFTLLGHSMGALVGIVYVGIFPEDVETFISVDFIKPWSLSLEDYTSYYRKYYLDLFKNETNAKRPPLEYEEEEIIKLMIDGSRSLDESSAKLLLERGAVKNGSKYILRRDLKAKSYFIGFIPLEEWIQYAKEIKCPVLLLKAADGRSFDTPQNLTAMINAFKEDCKLFRYLEFEGKHHFHLTHPEDIGPAIAQFLKDSQDFINILTSE